MSWTYSDAGLGCLDGAVPYTGYTVFFFVEENDICHFPQLGAFLSDVLFDVEYGSRVLLTKVSIQCSSRQWWSYL